MDKIINEVLSFAKEDDRVRWVMLTGSRTNPLVEVDAFQDYDIQLGVHDLASFLTSDAWLDRFGERVIMQKPEAMRMFKPSLGGRFTYLMQFVNGSRLDLMLVPLDKVYPIETNARVLLDKDKLIDMTRAVEPMYLNESFDLLDCINEFLWLSYYVVKGVKRGQMIYAQDHLSSMRNMVLELLAWQRGVNPGQSYKYLEKDMGEVERSLLYRSYQHDEIMLAMFSLFELMATKLEGYEYDRKEFNQVMSQHEESVL